MEQVTVPKFLLLDLIEIQARFEPLAQFASPELRSVVDDCGSKINEIVRTAGVESIRATVHAVVKRTAKRKKTQQQTNSNPGPSNASGIEAGGRPQQVNRRTRRPFRKLTSGAAPRPPVLQQVKYDKVITAKRFYCLNHSWLVN